MIYEEFDQGIFKLKNAFGEKFYQGERLEILWTMCSHVPLKVWDKIINDLIGSCRMPPIAKDFEERLIRYSQIRKNFDFKPRPLVRKRSCPEGHSYDETYKFCSQCLKDGNLAEIMVNPYETEYIPKELHETASFFKRQSEENLTQYAIRTVKRRQEIYDLYQIKANAYAGIVMMKDIPL